MGPFLRRFLSAATLSFFTGLLSGCAGGAAPKSEDGWVSLFNGGDLTGWVVRCKPEDREKHFWKVEDGAITADSIGHRDHDYIWLLSAEEYDNFELRLKVQGFRESPGNSGVQVRSRYDDEAGWLDGPQVDINPPAPWRTGMVWDETRGNQRWLYPTLAEGQGINESLAVPGWTWKYAGDGDGWNDLHITCRGNRLEAVLNGVAVMQYDGHGVLDDEVHRKRNVGTRGHIALQIHRGDSLRIRFKDIRLRKLSE